MNLIKKNVCIKMIIWKTVRKKNTILDRNPIELEKERVVKTLTNECILREDICSGWRKIKTELSWMLVSISEKQSVRCI